MKLQHFLLTALILFTGVSGTYATKLYVGFTAGSTHPNLQAALDAAKNNKDTVCVATGLYVADDAEFTVHEGVTLIGGYNKGNTTAPRRYPGEFVPFDSSVVNLNQFTVLDGNAYKRTRPTEKHRVIRVENGGVVDGCLIRNGHVRNDHGGGVLLDGGKLYNSIVRGNVAMSKPDTIESLGGGVFIKNAGELINCLVAYNMANDGYGVAAGQGGGKMINNTITANTYSPVFSKIPGTPTGQPFQMYKGSNNSVNQQNHRPAISGGRDTIPKLAAKINLSDFYLSRTETTQGQYAVFCAAIDIPKPSYYGQLDLDILQNLQDPIKGGKINVRYGAMTSGVQNAVYNNEVETTSGLHYANGVWHPIGDTSTVEYPIGNVNWYGALAYAVWLGGCLPSEAQWEYAARLNSDGTLSENLYSGAYGSSFAVSSSPKTDANDTATWRILDTIAWVANSKSIDTATGGIGISGTDRVHEVARKRPNAMGIYDMTGNVAEHTIDVFNDDAGGEIYTSGATDPIRLSGSTYRTCRGYGSFSRVNRSSFSLSIRYASVTDFLNYTDRGIRPIAAF